MKHGDVHLLCASCPNFHYEIYSAKMEAHSAPRMEARSGTKMEAHSAPTMEAHSGTKMEAHR